MRKLRYGITIITQLLIMLLLFGTAVFAEPAEESASWDHIVSVVNGGYFTAGLRSDGRVAYAGVNEYGEKQIVSDWEGIVRMELLPRYYPDSYYLVGYRENGSVVICTVNSDSDYARWTTADVADWDSVSQLMLTIDPTLCIGIRDDGSVLAAAGEEEDAQLADVLKSWTDIVQIVPSYQSFLGLKNDGTVISSDPDNLDSLAYMWGKHSVPSGIRTLIPSFTLGGGSMIYAIEEDGTLLGIPEESEYAFMEPSGDQWTDVTDLFFSDTYALFALNGSGQVYSYIAEDNMLYWGKQYLADVGDWDDIVQFNADYGPIGLRRDGTVVSAAAIGDRDTWGWKNIEKLYCGSDYTVGLCRDGSVLTTGGVGGSAAWLSEAAEWTDVADISVISPCSPGIVGLKKDGTVVAAGDNSFGQFSFEAPGLSPAETEEQSSPQPEKSTTPAEKEEPVRSGSCGDNVTWTLDENGTLYVEGSGVMDNYSVILSQPAPWYGLRDEILHVHFSDSILTVGRGAFTDCINLQSVNFPQFLRGVGFCAFENCASLTEALLPSDVQIIEFDAFRNCTGLQKITVHKNAAEIGDHAFAGCRLLKTAGPIGSGCDYEFGWSAAIPDHAFSGCHGLISVTLPDNIREIGQSAFSDCSSLTEIMLPAGLQVLGDSAFMNCSGLLAFSFPAQLKQIGERTFFKCSSLEEIHIPGTIELIGKEAFFSCSSLKTLIMDEGLQVIKENAFSDCTSLKSFVMPETLGSVGRFAFSGCTDLESVAIPETLRSIGLSAFSGCTELKSAGPTGSDCDIVFGWKTEIPSCAFSGCTGLEKILFPEQLETIGSQAFSDCARLQNIRLPEGVTVFGTNAFASCSSLKTAGPYGSGCDYEFGWTDSIPPCAFRGCDGLNSVILPESLKSIGKQAFLACTSLRELCLPEGITVIGDYCFTECTALEKLNLPSVLTEIGSYAFSGCSSLTELVIPDSVSAVGAAAFLDCRNLRQIKLPKDLTAIESATFSGCRSLTAVSIPDSVTRIGTENFYLGKGRA